MEIIVKVLVSLLSIFLSRAKCNSGDLIILRGEETSRWRSYNKRTLICASENDGNALVWNTNLIWAYSDYQFTDRKGNTRFYDQGVRNDVINCDFKSYEGCVRDWNITKWSLTDSLTKFMGPVLDYRWEEFTELNNFNGYNEYRLVQKLSRSGALVFSVRAYSDAHLLLCDSNDYRYDFCYWIIIGGWENTQSAIRKCATGVPPPHTLPKSTSECYQKKASILHVPLSVTEWRTFVLTWNDTNRNISLYDTKNMLMTYVDSARSVDKSIDTYHFFIRSLKAALFRFHTYSFFHTTDREAVLTSPDIDSISYNLCVQIFLALCVDCQLEIIAINRNSEQLLKIVDGSAVTAAYELPMWRIVTINETLSIDFNRRLRIKLVPLLKKETDNPFWAIGNFRNCPSTGAIRLGTIEATQDYANGYYWPNVTCQKISYDADEVVSSIPDPSPNVTLLNPDCQPATLRPDCSVNCYDYFHSTFNCRRVVLCDSTGCTCSPGFKGQYCDEDCPFNTYGLNCKGTCGNCLYKSCHIVTGSCTSGCDNSEKYHIPPRCKTAIDSPAPPSIDYLDETSVQISIEINDMYAATVSSYVFTISKNKGVHINPINEDKETFNNSTTLKKTFDNLDPGTVYWVNCILYVEKDSIQISGETRNFTTRCTATSEFELEPEETSIIIKNKFETFEYPYPCPASWYDILIQETETGSWVNKGTATEFPYKYSNLIPYTAYNVEISKEDKTYFADKIQTLEAAPSRVQNIRSNVTTGNAVTLTWQSPKYSNGLVRGYSIKLQILTYYGCRDSKRISPDLPNEIKVSTEFTSYTFNNLHAYVRYAAEVQAFTLKYGPEETTEFDTKTADIPTARLSNLTIRENVLYWSMPEDCTTISGPIRVTRIKIVGVSEPVKDFQETRQTRSYFFDLKTTKKEMFGAETYRAQIFPIRDYNERNNDTAYTELIFKTLSKAPPAVSNLEIVEVDLLKRTTTLRWSKLRPPTNGEFEYYNIYFCCSRGQIVSPQKIPREETCNLWNDYVCVTINQPNRLYGTIVVRGHNKDVPEAGKEASIRDTRTEKPPEAPRNFSITPSSRGEIDLNWSHPWRTGGHLEKFIIDVKVISSKLRKRFHRSKRSTAHDYPITNYQAWYNETLYLQPSTTYEISLQAVTNTGSLGEKKFSLVETPSSTAFTEGIKSIVQNSDSTISLHIPTLSNDTENTVIFVIVKGPLPCETRLNIDKELAELAGVAYYEIAWLAGKLSPEEYAGNIFTVGDNKIYGGATNCPLKPEASYEVTVIVKTEDQNQSIDDQVIVAKTSSIRIGELPRRNDEAWLIPLFVFLIVAAIVVYVYRRRTKTSFKQSSRLDEMPLSRNDNYETKCISSSVSASKQSLEVPTPSDKESLSRLSTPDVPIINSENNIKGDKQERTSLVKVKDFEDYVREAIDSGLLDKQYETFPRGQTKPWDYGKLPQNKTKNRYGNLIAYDETRVILKKLPDDSYSDYINANYIKGYKKEKCYIATQGPKTNTVLDFWRMIWQEEVLIICMLTNINEGGKTKCEQYWPDIGKKKKYGDVIVLNAKHNVFADYTFRTLHVTCGEITRKVEHLHFTAWPDHGVPLYTQSVVTYLKKLLATPPGSGPVVVHCSAGVGRTGTIILCDICLRRAAAEGVVDVFAETESIRSQRANMVDNKQQYLLAHLALVECLLSFPTALPCNDVLSAKIKEFKKQLAVQKQRLQDTAWQDEALRPPTTQTSLSKRNLAKNRFPELVSEKVSRVYLKRYPVSDEDSDYISAVYVDGVRLQNQYLATQLPLPSTFNDFWRMIAEFKIELIVMLQPPDPNDPTCCSIAPKTGEFKPTPYINVIAKETTELEYYTLQKLTLIDNSEKPSREQPVTILCSTEWKPGRNQEPPAVIALVTVWQATERISRGDGPTVVLCHDGVTGCGLYLAMNFLLERMAVERECDVCLAIRAVRRSRPDFVQSIEHMEYLYDAAVTYLEYFETYANFT